MSMERDVGGSWKTIFVSKGPTAKVPRNWLEVDLLSTLFCHSHLVRENNVRKMAVVRHIAHTFGKNYVSQGTHQKSDNVKYWHNVQKRQNLSWLLYAFGVWTMYKKVQSTDGRSGRWERACRRWLEPVVLWPALVVTNSY